MKRIWNLLKHQWVLVLLTLVALLLAGLAWRDGGAEALRGGVVAGAETLESVALLLVAAFLIAGLTQTLVSQEMIDRWLSARSGWRGILLACFAGALIPGGPYVYYPIAGALLQSGAGLGVLISFVTAKNLWSVTRLPLEFALLGSRLTIIRFLLTLVVPPALGFLGEAIFGRYLSQVREGVQ